MNILKVTNGKVELRTSTGTLIRTVVSNGASDADLNNDGSLILITTNNGKIELRKDNGTLIRTITSGGAKSAKFSG